MIIYIINKHTHSNFSIKVGCIALYTRVHIHIHILYTSHYSLGNVHFIGRLEIIKCQYMHVLHEYCKSRYEYNGISNCLTISRGNCKLHVKLSRCSCLTLLISKQRANNLCTSKTM